MKMTPSVKKKILTREEILAAATPSTEDDRRCSECNIVFQNLGAKNMHLLKTHGISKNESSKNFADKNDNDETAAVSDGFQCSDCEKAFQSRKLLIQHFQKMHKPKNLKCNFCPKSFSLERDLRYHQANRCKKKRLADSCDTVSTKRPKTIEEVLQSLPFELPPHLKIIDITKTVTSSTQTDTVIQDDAGLQVYIEQPYYNPSQDPQYSEAATAEPIYINQYQQTYTIPCPNYADWRHSETQTQNPTSTIGTTTPYWPQEYGYASESGTQTWYPSEPQMTDSYSMTDEHNYIQ